MNTSWVFLRKSQGAHNLLLLLPTFSWAPPRVTNMNTVHAYMLPLDSTATDRCRLECNFCVCTISIENNRSQNAGIVFLILKPGHLDLGLIGNPCVCYQSLPPGQPQPSITTSKTTAIVAGMPTSSTIADESVSTKPFQGITKEL